MPNFWQNYRTRTAAADAEDASRSISVGGMAADLGVYTTQVAQFRDMLDTAGVKYGYFEKPAKEVDWAGSMKYLFEIFSDNDPWYSQVSFDEAGNMMGVKHRPYD